MPRTKAAKPTCNAMTASRRIRIGILGSSSGKLLLAIANHCDQREATIEIGVVLSDVAAADILSVAASRRLKCAHVSPGAYRRKIDEAAEDAYINALREEHVEFAVLTGFQRIVNRRFAVACPHGTINVHFSLLPAFSGEKPWIEALEYGVKVTGCTTHMLDGSIHPGVIIDQFAVAVLHADSPEILRIKIEDAAATALPRILEGIATTVRRRGSFAR